MIRYLVFVFILALCLSFMVTRSEAYDPSYEIVAVYGSTPIIDGVINSTEWIDAASVSFNNTDVFVKQDGANLYIGFNNSEAPYHEEDFVGIFIDVNNDGGSTLLQDDIAVVIYRNGTLLEVNVTEGQWNLTSVSGWTASLHSTLDVWQAEFNITYSKIEVIANTEKTIGVLFAANYRAMLPYPFCWPPKYYPNTYDNPSEWGGMTSTDYNWIPEFPQFLVLPLFIMATLSATIVYKTKHTK